MTLEIERKFLVINDKWRNSILSESELKQGYIANLPHATVRVRIADGAARLNIKGKTTGIRRAEFESDIPLTDAEAMLQGLAERPFIEKTRSQVQWVQHRWDLDLFAGRTRAWSSPR